MVCPVCNKDMLVLEFELVEIDHCAECGGVWLDCGELALIGQRAGALHGDLLAALESGPGEPDKTRPKRRCPVCRKRLLRARTAAAQNPGREMPPRRRSLVRSRLASEPSSRPPARTAEIFSSASSRTSPRGEEARSQSDER